MPILRGYRRTKLAVIAAVIIVTVVAWGSAAAWLWRDYRQSMARAENELIRLSIVASDETRRLLSLADIFLDSLEQILILSNGDMEILTSPMVTQRIDHLLERSDNILDVAVIDHAGTSTILPYSPQRLPQAVPDRDYFRDAKIGKITVAAPLKGRASGEWIIPVSRRVADPANRIAVLLSAIHIPAMERLFDGIRHSKGGAISLFRRDGILLVRSPSQEGLIGRSVADGVLFREKIPAVSEGVYVTISQFDGKERLAAYRSVDEAGFVILVSQTMAEVLAPWRRMAWLTLSATIVFTVVISIAALLLLRLVANLEGGARMLDQRVKERTADMLRLMEARSSFLTNISHELRTPLNAIIGFSDALLARLYGTMPERQSEVVMDIHRSGLHLLALVNDLLDSAAVDAGSLRLDETEFNLKAALEEAVSMVLPRAQSSGVTVAPLAGPERLCLRADRRRLIQAILNLCGNAIKYNVSGGQVTVTWGLDPWDCCVITVVDTGIGMSPQDLTTALTPFGRISSQVGSAVEGTGLGLPLTSRIIELHGGTLTVESAVGKGTIVTISLPQDCVRPPVEMAVG